MSGHGQQREQADRTGEYGGDDGALEHERERIEPGEDQGLTGTPGTGRDRRDRTQAEEQQDRELATGEENPG